ncbi:MAG: hypothetical protein HZB39_20720 [Planctomycetes bacterium]|nr:hypothetical protein [Planctomycetota bacterium]
MTSLAAPHARTRRRRRGFGCLLAILLAVAALGLLELGLRLFVGPVLGHVAEARDLYVLSGDGYALRPDARTTLTLAGRACEVRIDGLGLRGDPLPPPGDAPRILVLGDSMVFGLGLEQKETIPSQLGEVMLAHGVRAAVANGGVPGYGTSDVAAAAARLVPRIGPRLVVACVYLGNDFEDDVPLGHGIVAGHLLSRPRADAARDSWHAWLVMHVLTAQVVERLTARWVPEWSAARGILRRAEPVESTAFAGWPPPNCRVEGLCFDADPAPRFVDDALARLAGSFADLKASCAGTSLLVVVIPCWRHLLRPVWEDSLRTAGLDPAQHRFGAIQERVARVAAEAGVEFVDLTAGLASSPELLSLFLLPHDGHFSPAGARRVAELLLDPVLARFGR